MFSDPTTPFMLWHHDIFAPWVQQLQHDADRAYTSTCSNRGGRTVLDQARDNLRREVASTFDHMHPRAILAEMTRLLDAGWDQNQSLLLANPVLRKQSVHTGDALGPVLPCADVPVLDVSLTRS